MRIHPRQIEAFRAVMLTGGMTAAAAHLGVSQPAVSRLVKDLEASLHLALFEREGNRLTPRQEARTLYREVDRFYVGLDRIAKAADDIRAIRGGTLRIGAVPVLSRRCVDTVVERFVARYPDVTIILDTDSSQRILDLVAMQHYDVGFVQGGADHAGIRSVPFPPCEAVCVLPSRHVLAARASVSARDLDGERLIAPGRSTPLGHLIEGLLKAEAIRCESPIEASTADACTFVSKGLGVAIADPLTASGFRDVLAIRPFRPIIPIRFAAVFPLQAPRSRVVDEFADLVQEVVRREFEGGPARRRAGLHNSPRSDPASR